jgi:predicted Fe-S protein YdhL (DUF1289 family)
MKLILMIFLICPFAFAQDLSPDEQRALLKEVQSLKERVNQLEKKDSGQGFKSTDYSSKTTETKTLKSNSPQEPAMTPEQRKEIMETVEKYKKAQVEQEKALKELEDEE